jgi:hypothetical protein
MHDIKGVKVAVSAETEASLQAACSADAMTVRILEAGHAKQFDFVEV